jgi:hypothetical protein
MTMTAHNAHIITIAEASKLYKTQESVPCFGKKNTYFYNIYHIYAKILFMHVFVYERNMMKNSFKYSKLFFIISKQKSALYVFFLPKQGTL